MLRTWRISVALAASALVAAGCGGDDEASEQPTAPAGIELATVEGLASEHFDSGSECADGAFSEDDEVFMVPDELETGLAEAQSYDCGGRVEQIAYARFEDPTTPEKLQGETVNGVALTEGDTAVLVNYGAEDDFDIAGFFEAIQAECDCGETTYEPPTDQ